MSEIAISSPAKVNLFLDVLKRRPDGYHEVETVLTTIGLADDIRIRLAGDCISVSCPAGGAPEGDANLAWRAAALLAGRCGKRRGVQIEIDKRIPEAAGLGGGSSNAACTLLGLNRLWDLGLSKEELSELAAELGMDVPFFIHAAREWGEGGEQVEVRGAALARGRGDEITALCRPPEGWLVLAMPDLRISTGEAYGRLRLGLTPGKPDLTMFLKALERCDLQLLSAYLYNRLEEVALDMHPDLACLKARLCGAGAVAAMVSGSGPVVFGLASCREDACRIASGVIAAGQDAVQDCVRTDTVCVP